MLVHKNMPCPEKETRTEENFTDLQNSDSH
jgi:hypothetical protein